MDSSLIGMIVAIVILVMCSAYFSATETAFTSLNTIPVSYTHLTLPTKLEV